MPITKPAINASEDTWGDILNAALDTLFSISVPRYANAAARDADITAPVNGQLAYTTGVGLTIWITSQWITLYNGLDLQTTGGLRTGTGAAVTFYGGSGIQAIGSAADQTLHLRSKGTAAVYVNGVSGDGTGGLYVLGGGATPTTRFFVNGAGLVSATPGTSGAIAYRAMRTGEGNVRWSVRDDGQITWGNGTDAGDTNLYRNGVDSLRTDDNLTIGQSLVVNNIAQVNRATAGSNTWQTFVTGEAVTRTYVTAAGDHYWGDGTNTHDVRLYRESAGLLTTDTIFRTQGGAQIGHALFEKSFTVAFPNGAANQKVDLYYTGTTTGTFEISIVGEYGGADSEGFARALYSVGHNGAGAIHHNVMQITDTIAASKVLAHYAFAPQVVWDATNSRYKITIAHLTSTGNSIGIVVRFHGVSPTYINPVRNSLAVSAVYTTDATIPPSNVRQGTATLAAGTATIANTAVTANSRIMLTAQNTSGTPGFLRVSNRTAGTDFTITSSSNTDTSTVAWHMIEA